MDSKEDEEISIDLGKIKNFFKGSKKEEGKEGDKQEASKEEKSDDIEFSFDMAKIKKFFKPGEKGPKADDDISVDWNKFTHFFKKYGVVFIALVPIILAVYIRAQAGSLPVTDDWAASTVINSVRLQIRSSIDQQYPNLPDANKNALVEAELQKVISQSRGQIDETIKSYSKSFKSLFQDDSGRLYMPDIDPYYWYRYAKNIAEHGHPGDILKDGRPFDTYQLAPNGRFVVPDMFHSYSSAYFYKFLHFLIPGLELMRSMFYLTIFISALCVLLVFLIGRKIAGNTGGFFAGLIMAVNGAFLSRSLHPDNDIWVIFFPLLVTWLFVTTIDLKNTLRIIIISLIAGLFTGLFTNAWSGWWYIFDFLLATIFFTFVYLALANFSDIRKSVKSVFSNPDLRSVIIVGLVYFVSTALFATLFSGFSQFSNSFIGPLSFQSIKAPVQATSLWPNVLTTVAELNEGSIDGIINSIGGKFLFYISLLGLILSISRSDGMKRFDFAYIIGTAMFYGLYFMLRRLGFSISIMVLLAWILLPIIIRIGISVYRKDSSYDFKLAILLSLWIVSTIFASIKGIRFTLLLAPAFSVAFGVALGKIYFYLSRMLSKEFKIHKVVGSSILIMLLLLMYIGPTKAALGAASSDIPIVNDAWYNALTSIKQSSGKDAVITSWWDFGHHFKALAERRVTFDGTTQTSEAAHWVGKLLMTSSEEEAAGILRMLDCGSNRGFSKINEVKSDTHQSLKILKEIILLGREEAEKKLRELGFSGDQIKSILSYTHCQPPEAYFIASNDMIGKSGVWGHFGSWNFEKADIWANARRMPQEEAAQYMMKKFNYTREKAENTYFEIQSISSDKEANDWIAPWPGYGGVVSCNKNDKGIYICGNGFQIDMAGHDVYAAAQQGTVRPKIAAFTTESGLLIREFGNSTLDFGITIIPVNENEVRAVLSSKELTGGMFTRMFYMQGHGLRYFKLADHQLILQGSSLETNVYVYKIDWGGKNEAVVQDYVDYFRKPAMAGALENIALENTTIEPSSNNSK
ncbi:hypothetical protein HYX08_05135 [Candidatus Woesearchaeota archaeon]|nr:hypothetical protein [Candidatus Woesearchaeota archaeon]